MNNIRARVITALRIDWSTFYLARTWFGMRPDFEAEETRGAMRLQMNTIFI